MMNTPNSVSQSKKDDKIMILLLSLFLFIFFFCCSKMSPLYLSNEWSDINIYETIGRAIMSGKSLYVDVFDPKGPMIFIIYALGSKLSSSLFLGMFIILYALWFLVLSHLYFTLKRYVSNVPAFLICIISPYFALNYLHTCGSPEEFILIANIFIISLFVRYQQSDSIEQITKINAFSLGIFSCMILLLKFNLSSFYFFILLSFIVSFGVKKRFNELIQFIVCYMLGFILILFSTSLYLYLTNALQATIDSYILLNSKIVSNFTLEESIRMGLKRLLELFKYHFLGTLLLCLGGFCYPMFFIKEITAKLLFLLAVASTFIIIYFTGVAHFYYTLPLYCLVPLGLLVIFELEQKFIKIKYKTYFSVIALVFILGLSILQTKFWGLNIKQLTRTEKMPGVNYQFAETINAQSKTPSLLVLSYGDAINIFSLCNIIPDNKYFTTLNLSYDVYPDMQDSQKRVIENKEVEYIVLNEGNGVFNNYKPLDENYSIVDTFEGYEEFQNVRIPKRTFLYRRN